MSDRRRLGTTEQVSEHLGVPVRTLYDWKLRGIGPQGIRVGKYLRYRWEDVERWLDEQAKSSGVAGTSAPPVPTRVPRRKPRVAGNAA